jgi:hypothetical protein
MSIIPVLLTPTYHGIIESLKNIESKAKIVFCSFFSIPYAWKGRGKEGGGSKWPHPPSKSKTTESITICLTCLFWYHHPNLRVLSFKPIWNKLLLISRPLCALPSAQVWQRQLKTFFMKKCSHIKFVILWTGPNILLGTKIVNVFRIRDLLLRIRILGSVLLDKISGKCSWSSFGSWSYSFWQRLLRCRQKITFFAFFSLYHQSSKVTSHWEGTKQ